MFDVFSGQEILEPYFRRHPDARKRFVGLVGCGKAKRSCPSTARNLYIGGLTKLAISWMERNCETFFILSAKWGLLEPRRIIRPYDLKMADLTDQERRIWAKGVRKALPPGRPFLAIAGRDYLEALEVDVVNICQGLDMFQRMAWLRANPILTDGVLASCQRSP